ncbi:nSTAND1 domain-containing NTPase [Chryseolinea lacunae]|uniref:High-affnity carbon uptake protein Hat/HatR n=1 Tax=Chryseolinea lacunae TaxID=2801331 RepID=A0ABS1KY66_9BACT|nr:High-affnity carbon uptake protein Hat/HatR [Chryseolinea lacunae]MBL0744319.1 High-affnity carbon uptake protein Hat/HatR [Chryseolinea lacunae]
MLNEPLHSGHEYNREVPLNFSPGEENPFPGLRPFSIDDSHLFFGRDGQIDDILLKITRNRFVTVMGYSGSGKSSLMSCGLIPFLYGGFDTESGSFWNVVATRPGSAPLNGLTESIVDFMVKTKRLNGKDAQVHRAIVSSVLRSGSDGLIQIARYLQRSGEENVFFHIDQFEEIFRYREMADSEEALNEAQLYVNLVLTAIQQSDVPVYIALTMRSDFVGECSVFAGLTQQINQSNYLVPQLTRDQKRSVIEGPVTVAGGAISNRLVKRLLNDVGNNQDQLPILQHALMRTWDYWISNHEPGEPIDIRHYNAVGKVSQALAQHANEAYDELSTRDKQIAEVLFKNITEKNQNNRGKRRACRLGLVAELAEASEEEVIAVVDQFRRAGRSFLMPAANIPLNTDSMIELSHESLMRIWNRLESWVDDEFESASMYKRLSEAAAMYQIGKTGLWRPPDLQLALNWQKKQNPTREWGQRYDEAFERAIVFLDTSRITYEAELKNQEMMQRRVLRRTRATAIILGIAFIVAIIFFVFAYLQKLQADTDRLRAEKNRQEAVAQSKIAKANQRKAEEQAEIVKKQKAELQQAFDQITEATNQLQIALNTARVARNEAIQNLVEANVQRDSARVERNRAQTEYVRAEKAYTEANRLFMLTKAQELASKAAVEDDDNDLAGLMAMQGFMFHRRYEGKKYEPYIYTGLYSALTKINGLTYNAMKIQGPPRVHMKSLIVSDKNNEFYSAGADGRIYKGDFDKLTNAATPFANPYPTKTIGLSKDETYLVNGSDSAFVQIYNLKAGGKPLVVKGLSGGTNSIQFLPDNSAFIVSSVGNTLSQINAKTGEVKKLASLPYELKSLSLSSDGKTLAGASWSGQVVLINLADMSTTLVADDNPNRVLSIKFSPSGRYLAYGVDDVVNKRGLVKIYDFTTKETRQFTGHRAGVNDVEFSPDEKLLASAGLDKRLQLYVLENPEDLPVVMGNNNGFIWDIEFAKGSDYLIAACSESEIRVWPTDPSLLAEKICPKLTRNMTQDEWKKYVGDVDEIPYENTCVRLLIKEY